MPVSVNNKLLVCQPWPCNPVTTTALHPPIWRFASQHSHTSSDPEEWFLFAQTPVLRTFAYHIDWYILRGDLNIDIDIGSLILISTNEYSIFIHNLLIEYLWGVTSTLKVALVWLYLYYALKVYQALHIFILSHIIEYIYIYIYIHIHIHIHIHMRGETPKDGEALEAPRKKRQPL